MIYKKQSESMGLMIKIPEGKILLKDDRIKKQWKVDIKPFFIGKYPVTQDLHYKITNTSPSIFKGERKPVENISWEDAICFCNLLSEKEGLSKYYSIDANNQKITCNQESDGYRLPTEAEWEYACRAGSTEARYGELNQIAWFEENAEGRTHEVGQKEPNAWGLYDMLGNVWEWCWDVYDEEIYGSYRIFRGGGWADPARGCLATNRRRSHPTFYIDDLGFRLARSIIQK